jgi:hypothetical protein
MQLLRDARGVEAGEIAVVAIAELLGEHAPHRIELIGGVDGHVGHASQPGRTVLAELRIGDAVRQEAVNALPAEREDDLPVAVQREPATVVVRILVPFAHEDAGPEGAGAENGIDAENGIQVSGRGARATGDREEEE